MDVGSSTSAPIDSSNIGFKVRTFPFYLISLLYTYIALIFSLLFLFCNVNSEVSFVGFVDA